MRTHHRPGLAAALGLVLLSIISSPPAWSDDRPDPFFCLDAPGEALVLANAWGGVALARLVQGDYPSSPAWTDTNRTDDFFYQALRRPDCDGRKTARFLSDVGLASSVPLSLTLLTVDAPRGDKRFTSNAVLIAESTGLTMLATEMLKLATARERPYSRGGRPCNEEKETDTFMSFPSGHTSLTFATAVATSRIAHIRGYRHATAIQLVMLSTAIGTGYLRIAADKHYFSDVVVGALVGSIVSAAVVEVHRRAEPSIEVGEMIEAPVFRIGVHISGDGWAFIAN